MIKFNIHKNPYKNIISDFKNVVGINYIILKSINLNLTSCYNLKF